METDQLNGILALDEGMANRLSRLASHLSIMDLHRPFTVSDDVALPAPVLATINHWLDCSPGGE